MSAGAWFTVGSSICARDFAPAVTKLLQSRSARYIGRATQARELRLLPPLPRVGTACRVARPAMPEAESRRDEEPTAHARRRRAASERAGGPRRRADRGQHG